LNLLCVSTTEMLALELDSLDALLKVIIQARIAAGLTQEDLAARLGPQASTDPTV